MAQTNNNNDMNEYEQPDALNSVAEFHRTFGHPVLETPMIPDLKRTTLRINLLQEELNELSKAIRDEKLVDVADALCDLQYVLAGAILEFGLASRFKALFDEVQRSNMSKACSTVEEANRTQINEGMETETKQVGEKLVVYRVMDSKVIKSVDYSPANLTPILKPTFGELEKEYRNGC